MNAPGDSISSSISTRLTAAELEYTTFAGQHPASPQGLADTG